MGYTARQAARALGISEDYLRMKLRAGEYADIGEALRPTKGHKQWRFPCYPAKVAQKTGVAVHFEGRTYYPDGRVEEEA